MTYHDPKKYNYDSCVARMVKAIVARRVKIGEIVDPETARKHAASICEMIYGREHASNSGS